jgi:prepilin-type processing-associated H-X9-DG protein
MMGDLHRQAANKPAEAMPRIFLLSGLIDPLLASARVEIRDDAERSSVHLYSAPDNVKPAEVIKLFLPAVQASRAAALRAQSVNNLKQIGLAMHNYNNANGHFPPAVLIGPDGKTPYSWRVALLPYIEQQELFKQYNFSEPWDGPNNRKLLDKIPPIYRAPNAEGDPTFASYFVPTGPDTLFPGHQGTQLSAIRDGPSNTIMAVEARRPIPWTKPEDIPFDVKAALPEFGGYSPGGFNVLFTDGSVRFVSVSVNPEVLRALFTIAGGEVIELPKLDPSPARPPR